MPTKFWSENLKGRWPRMADYGQSGSLSGLGSVIGCCECGNELLGSTKSGKLLEYRHDY